MISEMAIDDLEALKSEGLEPTYKDIIRLNAMALKYEAEKGKLSFDPTYTLPRVAVIDNGLYFREPSIGHDIWLQSISRHIDENDYETMLAVQAFALSRDQKELPQPDDLETIKKAVEDFAIKFKSYTRDQIYKALIYVKCGYDETYGENAPSERKEETEYDFDQCIALGVLNEGVAVLWGLSLADMKSMRRKELEAIIKRSYQFHNIYYQNDATFTSGQYYATLDDIRDRLIKEKENKQ